MGAAAQEESARPRCTSRSPLRAGEKWASPGPSSGERRCPHCDVFGIEEKGTKKAGKRKAPCQPLASLLERRFAASLPRPLFSTGLLCEVLALQGAHCQYQLQTWEEKGRGGNEKLKTGVESRHRHDRLLAGRGLSCVCGRDTLHHEVSHFTKCHHHAMLAYKSKSSNPILKELWIAGSWRLGEHQLQQAPRRPSKPRATYLRSRLSAWGRSSVVKASMACGQKSCVGNVTTHGPEQPKQKQKSTKGTEKVTASEPVHVGTRPLLASSATIARIGPVTEDCFNIRNPRPLPHSANLPAPSWPPLCHPGFQTLSTYARRSLQTSSIEDEWKDGKLNSAGVDELPLAQISTCQQQCPWSHVISVHSGLDRVQRAAAMESNRKVIQSQSLRECLKLQTAPNPMPAVNNLVVVTSLERLKSNHQLNVLEATYVNQDQLPCPFVYLLWAATWLLLDSAFSLLYLFGIPALPYSVRQLAQKSSNVSLPLLPQPQVRAMMTSWAAAKGHVWIHVSNTDRVYVAVRGSCYLQKHAKTRGLDHHLRPGVMVTSGRWWQLRAMSRSVAPLQPGSEYLISLAPVITESCEMPVVSIRLVGHPDTAVQRSLDEHSFYLEEMAEPGPAKKTWHILGRLLSDPPTLSPGPQGCFSVILNIQSQNIFASPGLTLTPTSLLPSPGLSCPRGLGYPHTSVLTVANPGPVLIKVAREMMAWWLKVLAAFAEDPGSVPSTHMSSLKSLDTSAELGLPQLLPEMLIFLPGFTLLFVDVSPTFLVTLHRVYLALADLEGLGRPGWLRTHMETCSHLRALPPRPLSYIKHH
ncbi:hypothetical protein U0070_026466 [Myodes glareolus]|uniref:Uncharacterized protein n=1 Tax=Myodes glareolus TaxID=447135 RepID=A0AAW0JK74_MYOGA